MDDIGDALDVSPSLPATRRTDLSRMADNLQPLVDAVRAVLRDTEPIFGMRLDEVTPEDREDVNRLRAILAALVAPVEGRLRALDQHVLVAATRIGADELPMRKGRAVRIKRGTSGPGYQTDAHGLFQDLVELAEKGLVTSEEVEQAVAATVEYKANHTTLNRLYRHRGEPVQAVIDARRKKVEPDPMRGRVEWPDPLPPEEEER